MGGYIFFTVSPQKTNCIVSFITYSTTSSTGSISQSTAKAMPSKESQKYYYSTIKDESALRRASEGEANLANLLQSGWISAACEWGREDLLAHRVVCSDPVKKADSIQ